MPAAGAPPTVQQLECYAAAVEHERVDLYAGGELIRQLWPVVLGAAAVLDVLAPVGHEAARKQHSRQTGCREFRHGARVQHGPARRRVICSTVALDATTNSPEARSAAAQNKLKRAHYCLRRS
jgi:hypothetical protein